MKRIGVQSVRRCAVCFLAHIVSGAGGAPYCFEPGGWTVWTWGTARLRDGG